MQELTKLDLYQGHDLETCVTSQGSGNDRAGCTADLLPSRFSLMFSACGKLSNGHVMIPF